MYTQIFNDGSSGLITNAGLDLNQKKRLEDTIKGLQQLTEPAKIMQLVNELVDKGILDGNDLKVLQEKGVLKAAEQNINKEKQQEVEEKPVEEQTLENDDDGR